jgi:drug/metabolite transporter (DMT)-like permease
MPSSFNGRRGATLIGALGVVLWATETLLLTFTGDVPPLEIVALAFGTAAALSAVPWIASGRFPQGVFRYPLKVWLVTVGALVGYHACIYYAVQHAPPAPAALLQGTTPLMIVLGSALLPGERLRWWHLLGTLLGLCGVLALVSGDAPGQLIGSAPNFYLALVGVAAGLWGFYSLATRTFAEIPTSALGIFYAVAALSAGAAHVSFERWVTPDLAELVAILALGAFPMGLALYCWDHGMKRGDLQALGGFSYSEPLLGAVFVAIAGQGNLTASMLWAGLLIIAGAAFGSWSVFGSGSRRVDPGMAGAVSGAAASTSVAVPFSGQAPPNSLEQAGAALRSGMIAEEARPGRSRRDELERLHNIEEVLREVCAWLTRRLRQSDSRSPSELNAYAHLLSKIDEVSRRLTFLKAQATAHGTPMRNLDVPL